MHVGVSKCKLLNSFKITPQCHSRITIKYDYPRTERHINHVKISWGTEGKEHHYNEAKNKEENKKKKTIWGMKTEYHNLRGMSPAKVQG